MINAKNFILRGNNHFPPNDLCTFIMEIFHFHDLI